MKKNVTIRFPRDISHLRNAVQLEPSSAGASATPNRQLIPFDLREAFGGDSVPSLSGQAPAAQEAVLASITRELNAGHYRFVGIRATDPLDAIFLSRMVHEASPDSRLVIQDADLLFVRAGLDSPLDGMLSVTTYPLLLENQKWSGLGKISERLTPFPTRIAEAVFNASTYAIRAASKTVPAGGSLIEFGWPSKGSHAPPLWVTVLGHAGYWPVNIAAARIDGPADKGGPLLQGFDFQYPDRLWVLLFGVTTLLAVAYFVCVVKANPLNATSLKPPRQWLEIFWSNPAESGRSGRAAYLSARNSCVSCSLRGFAVAFLENGARVREWRLRGRG